MSASDWLLLCRHCLLFTVVIVAVYTDIARCKIYNWCTLPAIFLGLLFGLAIGGLWGGGWRGGNLGSSALAIVMVAVVFAWPYLKGGIAAGDLKLMLAVAAVGGTHKGFIFHALLYTALVGALMALLVVIWRGRLRAGLGGALRFAFSLKRRAPEQAQAEKITVPYGVAISIGSILAWYMVEFPMR